MTENLVLNLSYFYDLVGDKASRDEKMKVLEAVARRFRLDDIEARFFS
ncbi:hypothetical protein NGA_0455800 [Nannochloropsis gaditana CCMP526]|nr:hypothetical protein NGA_0455800 [Nannochloropsis gaditana CCMP526]EKU22928.1 hypothetical protein NGA_0455800 [Nannochloropsis gaditana CCMP526]|eukprot:XP_005853431.1 hypothetical protein NGA_0455800 [Nannochloropsis gaditana CCMP526]